ncbi:MAG: type II toxin-antitoxin system HicA family toxin [Candidatus Bathyarchaeia archaeon]
MQKLPPLSGRKVVKALSKAGFEIVGRKGSHVRLKKKTPAKTPTKTYIVIVPMHPEIKKGTLKSIIRQSGLSPEEFLKLLK